ncbi:hypothetical protein ACQP1G_19855 [Nocardia sp. CA-107356]|uniref:hypothetical protein n=1 Tax=Nocardia sp. CA-107356 TaxID=3239972 RepID=UPI003D921925
MSVFDYIIGNMDRNPGNYLTRSDGRVAAIDSSLTFPESCELPEGSPPLLVSEIRSHLTSPSLNTQLQPEIVSGIRSVDLD